MCVDIHYKGEVNKATQPLQGYASNPLQCRVDEVKVRHSVRVSGLVLDLSASRVLDSHVLDWLDRKSECCDTQRFSSIVPTVAPHSVLSGLVLCHK